MRGLGRLGDTTLTTSPSGTIFQDPDTGIVIDTSTGTMYDASGNAIANPYAMPSTPAGVQNPTPVVGGGSNGAITTVPAATPSQNPLDYTSPQAAIAAGLNPTTVYNTWSKSLARFPSPQAAISAGVPAGVVNQLWQQSNVAAANAAAASATTVPWGMIAAGAGGLLLLSFVGGRRRR